MKIKKFGLCCLLLSVLVSGAIAFSVSSAEKAYAVSMQGSGDTFEYLDENYDAGETFVYSATVNFSGGTAAGLLFGGKRDESCFVFNVDRAANRVKLIYFYFENGVSNAIVLKEEYYVGPSIMNEGEKAYVQSRTAGIDKVYLKVAVDETGKAEFYADGIKRFAFTNGCEEAKPIDLNGFVSEESQPEIKYTGGLLGYNCFNATVSFTDTLVSASDIGNYAEHYRNQYHFSQFAHWNNDPNGMVYYNGYYHLYFQHNPYGNTWDVMHWGHARSKDLVHWEMLPIALVPDYDLSKEEDYGIGAMWSGSAMVYRKGYSDKIDNEYKWFGDVSGKQDGEELGLIAFYTRFDKGGNRHQIVAYSTDGGLTWNKRDNIPCSVSQNLDGSPVSGGSWRDPKVFDISSLEGITDGYKWGMALTDMEDNTLFFLKSKNLVNWEHAGSYFVNDPECPDVVTVEADDNTKHTVITFTSRYYTVCDLAYENGKIIMKDFAGNKIERLEKGGKYLHTMDYGVDSYAAQTFAIDADSDSKYAGKAVGLSWFSGVPNAPESIESGVLQSARKVWNGGGMTIPVLYGLKEDNGSYVLTTTPITSGNTKDFDKTPVSDLSEINGHCFEISASMENTEQKTVYFRINESEDGKCYTEIGWNKTDGYYVDRTRTEDAGIAFPKPNYARKYASGKGKSNTALDFYILSDNGGVEVYCDGFTIPFYVLTFASPYSVKASFHADGITPVMTINAIASVWREANEETFINLSATSVDLGAELGESVSIDAYADGKPINWSIEEGEGILEIQPTATGAVLTGKKAGVAKVKVECGASSRYIDVTVHSGSIESDFTFENDGVVSGHWYYSGNTLVGEQSGGDGFLLANEGGTDFTYTAKFDLGSGAAAALVFRAQADAGRLASYLIANYDKNGNIVKLWSQNGELAKVSAGNVDVKNITLTVAAKGRNVKVFLGSNKLIDVNIKETDPLEGRFGLNVCATRAAFSEVIVLKDTYDYAGNGDLKIRSTFDLAVISVINKTLGNVALGQGHYSMQNSILTVKQSYFELLPEAGEYEFAVSGVSFGFDVKINVAEIPKTALADITVNSGANAVIWLGNNVPEFVKVNGAEIDGKLYSIADYKLTVSAEAFGVGKNILTISDSQSVKVTVREIPTQTVTQKAKSEKRGGNTGLIVALCVSIGVAVIAVAVAVTLILLKKKKGEKSAEVKTESDNATSGDNREPNAETESEEKAEETQENEKEEQPEETAEPERQKDEEEKPQPAEEATESGVQTTERKRAGGKKNLQKEKK